MDAVSVAVAVNEREQTLVSRAPHVEGPCLGDVVVTDERSDPPRFTLHQVPGAPQVRCGSGAEAIEFARGFAVQHGVGAWLSSGGSLSRLVRRRIDGTRDGRV